jgi:hypothetical protein
MRKSLGGLAAVLILGASLSGCAASMGSVAGNVVGGAAWGLMKGGNLAWKGGTYAAKTAGKATVGAAKGVKNEFSGSDQSADGASTEVASEDTALGNRAKDAPPVASAQGHRTAFAD